jgi:YD repeat-containing protein
MAIIVSPQNSIGHLVIASVTDSTNSAGASMYVYSYDPMGRVVNQWVSTPSYNTGTSPVFQLSYVYDLAGNVTDLTYPSGRHVTQSWNGAGRLSQVNFADWSGQIENYPYASNISYAASGAPVGMTLGNGVTETFTENNRLQPAEISTGLDCVYTSGSSSSVDHNSSSGECGGSEGTWVPGYVDENWVHYNGTTNMFQVGSVDGTGSSATVDYANFSEGAQTDPNGGCTSGCGGYGFASANANWLQGQLVGNRQLSGLDGYIQFLTGREQPLSGGIGMQLLAGPLDASTDHWAGPGGMGPPGGIGDWRASMHDFNFSENGPAPGQGITIGMYFDPTLSPATSKALIQSNNNLMQTGGFQGAKFKLLFGAINAFQWYSNSWK